MMTEHETESLSLSLFATKSGSFPQKADSQTAQRKKKKQLKNCANGNKN